MVLLIAIPVGIAAIAWSYLWPKYEDFTNYFFTSLSHEEQGALLALLFAIMFAAVGISHTLSTGRTNGGDTSSSGDADDDDYSIISSRKKKRRHELMNYPLHEMNQALSDRSKFACLYPWLRDSILETMKEDNEMKELSLEYLSRMMDYTIMGGKFNRGVTVVAVYRVLLGRSLSPLEIAQASTLGWTIEFLQAFFLVADDVMDESETRRGEPCWYQNHDVQLKAINDAFLLESFLFTIVKKHFAHLPCYTRILELLLDVIQKTELGQLMDLISNKKGDPVDFSLFTLERYQAIVKYKTAYYSFYLPVALAMALAGIQDRQTYQMTQQICCIMGTYFQIQDDMMDCFGDPKHDNQVGTDIQDNKCTWLIVQALEKCNDEQRTILEENYGQDDDSNVQTVKKVYLDLKLEEEFQLYQEESYEQIQELISHIKVMPKNVFQILLKKIYKRVKK